MNFFFFDLQNLTMKLSQFRKIAKSARVNLNKYWGLLSPKDKPSRKSASISSSSFSMDFSEEEEQNRMNELLEAQANAEEQNSINSQIEYDSSPEQPRRLFVRQRAIASSYSSFSSSSSSTSSYCPHLQSHLYDDTISQDSVFF